MSEIKTVLVRFLKRCFIDGGRTVDPGDQAVIPASHFHPELHEKVATPEAVAPITSAPFPEDASAATPEAAPQ